MPTRVYLGHLSRDASDRDIERLFKNYGHIREVTVKNGFGFVDFDNSRDADDVVHDFHGRDFLGERLVVEIARGERRREDRGGSDRYGPPERTEYRLMVDNLAHGVSWQDIKDMMRKAGEVTYADLSKDQENQGVVEFQSEADVQKALKTMDGELLRGKPVALRLFDPSRDTLPREGGRGGRDRGRERDRERDRDRGDRYRGYSRERERGYSRDRGYDRERRDRDRRHSRSPSRDRRGRRGESRDRSRDRERHGTRRGRSRSRSRD
ncbi:RNA-binding domain-containing protein [Linnemannia elongata AG-77]|uniref:RNA-binding domain-containing protein n=1 Tax=Linnemannia elongata AG-77 TaxID=1314771 RepID=A0A197K0L5_9FUNG|nr:RNA-binding domain-containing protein [Linnemannia elongata AG-77]